jgi:acyl-CoA reductase-like NAD-dependent aldehyde dehydrogenase
MSGTQTTIIPHSQQTLAASTRIYPSETDLDAAIQRAAAAQLAWSHVQLRERIDIGHKFMVMIQSPIYFETSSLLSPG